MTRKNLIWPDHFRLWKCEQSKRARLRRTVNSQSILLRVYIFDKYNIVPWTSSNIQNWRNGQVITVLLICNTNRLKRFSLLHIIFPDGRVVRWIPREWNGRAWSERDGENATTRDRSIITTIIIISITQRVKKRTSVNFNLNQFKNIIHSVGLAGWLGQERSACYLYKLTRSYIISRKLIEDYLDTLSNLFIKELSIHPSIYSTIVCLCCILSCGFLQGKTQ